MKSFLFLVALAFSFPANAIGQTEAFPVPRYFGASGQLGRGVHRTMTLLDRSTQKNKYTVRILLYGQSITAGQWGVQLEEHLRQAYPHANLIYERKPLSGFSTERLVKTSEADLYPAYADLVIFHDYGNNEDYETMIRKLREQTTSEILIQGDHFRRSEQVVDESNPSKLESRKQQWAASRNREFLPQLARKYGCGFDHRRETWKAYLTEHDLQPGQLVKDDVHPNEHGTYLMTELIKAYLVPRSDTEIDPMNCGYVKTVSTSELDGATDRELTFDFDGNRIDAIFHDGASGRCEVLIDGSRPTDDPQLYFHGRNRVKWRNTPIPPGPWPPVLRMNFEKPLVAESWELIAKRDPEKPTAYTFDVVGSQTGPDGSGRTDQSFVSDSGRVVISAEDWDVQFAIVALRRLDDLPNEFQLNWNVISQAKRVVEASAVEPGIENCVTLAQRLSDDKHTLRLSGDVHAIKALRVYTPSKFPRGAAIE